ncbi:MAG TPA: type II toxin-antitoxin system RelE/ParE family toxin [Sphingomonas sp.]|jgi:mRNA interferase RelE/StbE|uniref:type II toxin-antitoxin system RelE family toxin n=1 Tax=Sphingomonas sp. TaxID=28214 RepID=UPI002EDB9229
MTTRTVTFERQALKDLKMIHKSDAVAIIGKIKQFAADPAALANNVTQLKGSAFSRLRVGDYRVIFTADLVVVHVVKIGHRREVYD